MKTVKKIVLTLLLGTSASGVQAQFTLDGEIRPRAEFRNGYKTLMDSSQTNAFFVDQRTRINFGYKVSDFEFYVSVQDIRVWGSTSQLNLTDGFLAIHESWGKANFNKNWGLKFGRQEIKYDDHRIFGNVDWAQQARSHDAALLQYKNEISTLDLGVAFNQATAGLTGLDYTGPSNYRDMYYAWYNRDLNDKINTSWLLMGLGRQAEPKIINYLATFGTHTKFDFDPLKINFNGYFQYGSDVSTYSNTGYKGYSAYLIGLDLNYEVSESFNIGLGYEAQSGTDQTDTTEDYNSVNRNFNPWFGTNHKFNGFMDYFYVGSGHGNAGLQDFFLNLEYKKDDWTIDLAAHLFMTGLGVSIFDTDTYTSKYNELIDAGNVVGANDLNPFDYTYASNLGTEIDLSVSTKLNKSVTMKCGYSYMLASSTLYNLKGVDYYTIETNGTMNKRDLPLNMWGYVMIIFKPKFME